MPRAMVAAPLPTEYNEVTKGFEIHGNGGLICTDVEMLNNQKGVLSSVVKQLAVNMMKGLSISHISLPIKIFEPRSSIQRMIDIFSGCGNLTKAAATTDPVERMKLVIAFSMSSIYLCISQSKPFNPLLGETHQGTFEDGTRFYCEHTSHHPPITNFLLDGPNNAWRLSGYYQMTGSMGANTLTSGLRGPNVLQFKNGTTIRYNTIDFKLGGTVMGERSIEATGNILYEDAKNGLRALMCMSTLKVSGWVTKVTTGSKDEVTGIIYQSNENPMKPTGFGAKQVLPESVEKLKDVKKQICKISGSWLKEILIDGKTYWNIKNNKPTRQQPHYPL